MTNSAADKKKTLWPRYLVGGPFDGERWCFPMEADRQVCADVGVEIMQAYDDAMARVRAGLLPWHETKLDELIQCITSMQG
jgi:hypothetical protein